MGYYSSKGYEIFVPVDSGRIDFIAHKDGELIKIQVKTAAKRRYKDTEYTVGILTSKRLGSTGCYELGEVDECFVVDGSRAWRIPHKAVYPNISVMLGSNKVKYKPKHELPVDSWEVSLVG